VYVAHTVDQWQRGGAIGGVGGGAWVRSSEGEEAAPFELSDGEAAVLVEPAGATFRVPYVSGELDGLMSRLRYREALLEEGAEAVVVGEAMARGGFDPSSGYRGHNLRTVIEAGSRGELLVATARWLRASTLLELLVRLACVLPGLALLAVDICLLANYLPQVTVQLPGSPSARAAALPSHVYPFYHEETLREAGVSAVGPARLEVRCLGFCVRGDDRLLELARAELGRRGLDGIVGHFAQERRLLIFEVVIRRGTAVRLPRRHRAW
jgi:hypothetical protein